MQLVLDQRWCRAYRVYTVDIGTLVFGRFPQLVLCVTFALVVFWLPSKVCQPLHCVIVCRVQSGQIAI